MAKQEIKIEQRDVESIVPYARNPRVNDPHVDRMAGLIREFGFRIPILITSDGTIIDGHLRIKAAQKLGMDKVPCMIADDMTPAQIKAFRLVVNKSVEWSEWDDDMLRLELEELKDMAFDLELTGFGPDDITSLLMNAGDGQEPPSSESGKTLAERFGVPPFSVLDARQGYWQARKRAWLSLGIQSELGRGGGVTYGNHQEITTENLNYYRNKEKGKAFKGDASPGGSPRPACNYSKRQRGDGRGRSLGAIPPNEKTIMKRQGSYER